MAKNQKLVFTMLTAILLLEFGSLTKIQKIWGLAFGVPALQGTQPNTNNNGIQVVPSHPVVTV